MTAFLPLLLRALPYIIGAALLAGGWFYADRACWSTACHGARDDLSALVAKVAKDDAARAAELTKRRADDDRAIARLREVQAGSESALRQAVDRAAASDKQVAALAAKLRATPAGGCLLPPDARRLWNDAVVPGGGAATRPAAAPDREAAAAGSPAGQAAPEIGVAPSERDAAPVDCVTVWEVGARNTARATFNADALDACNVQQVGYWQACTGRTLGGLQ